MCALRCAWLDVQENDIFCSQKYLWHGYIHIPQHASQHPQYYVCLPVRSCNKSFTLYRTVLTLMLVVQHLAFIAEETIC